MHRFWESGGRMIDVSPLYGMSEVNVGEFAEALGLIDELFIVNKIWATGDYLGARSHAQHQFEQSLQRLSRDRLGLLQVHSLVNVETFSQICDFASNCHAAILLPQIPITLLKIWEH